MEFKALKRRHAVIENAGFAAVPASYFAAAALETAIRHPDLALITMGYVFLLVWSRRQSAASLGGAPGRKKRGRKAWGQADLEAADRRFLRVGLLTAVAELAAFLGLIVILGSFKAKELAGTGAGALDYLALAVLIVVGGGLRFGLRRLAWRGFGDGHAELWRSPDGLALGRTARSPSAYFRWRAGAGPEE